MRGEFRGAIGLEHVQLDVLAGDVASGDDGHEAGAKKGGGLLVLIVAWDADVGEGAAFGKEVEGGGEAGGGPGAFLLFCH